MDKREQVIEWMSSEAISPNKFLDVLNHVYEEPTANDWQTFIGRLLQTLGGISVALGVMFFIAANWSGWSFLNKSLLVQSLLVISAILFYLFRQKKWLAALSAQFAFLMIGGLFALIGQHYQTGADPWQLFFVWSIVSLPLLFTTIGSGLLCLWTVVSTLGITLFFGQAYVPWQLLDTGSLALLSNAVFLSLLLSIRVFDSSQHIVKPWFEKLLVLSITALITIGLQILFHEYVSLSEHSRSTVIYDLTVFAFTWILGTFLLYRFGFKQKQLYLIACLWLSVIYLVGTLSFISVDDEISYWIFIVFMLIGISGFAVNNLMALHKRWTL